MFTGGNYTAILTNALNNILVINDSNSMSRNFLFTVLSVMAMFLILRHAAFAFCILSPTASFRLLFVFVICHSILLVFTHSILLLLYGSS